MEQQGAGGELVIEIGTHFGAQRRQWRDVVRLAVGPGLCHQIPVFGLASLAAPHQLVVIRPSGDRSHALPVAVRARVQPECRGIGGAAVARLHKADPLYRLRALAAGMADQQAGIARGACAVQHDLVGGRCIAAHLRGEPHGSAGADIVARHGQRLAWRGAGSRSQVHRAAIGQAGHHGIALDVPGRLCVHGEVERAAGIHACRAIQR
ncbi:hypothetical protein D3C87_1202740 [compost metagenome]